MSIAAAASRLANVFNGDVPSRVEHSLTLPETEFTAIAYNDRGTYLAAGCNSGELVIWDLVTLTPALRIQHLHRAEINAVTWVKKGKGRLVCTTSPDGWVKVFDLERRRVVMRLHFRDELVGAAMHPDSLIECLACLGANKSGEIPWPGLYRMDMTDSSKPLIQYAPKDFVTNFKCYGVAATFSKHGQLVFVGGVAGNIFAFRTRNGEHLRTYQPDVTRGLAKGWVVALSLSRNGRVLVSDGGGKVLCVYEVASDLLHDGYNDLPSDATVDMIQDALRWRAGRILTFKKHLQDVVGASKWSDVGCSGHAEFVMGASSATDVHEIFIWDVSGQLVDKLNDNAHSYGGVSRCAWHPWRPQIAVVVGSGKICLWGAKSTDELAFAPGFTEIEESIVVEDAPDAPANGMMDIVEHGALRNAEEPLDRVDVLANDSFPQVFSEDENSDEDEPSIRAAPRSVTRGIGYFIPATTDKVIIDASDL